MGIPSISSERPCQSWPSWGHCINVDRETMETSVKACGWLIRLIPDTGPSVTEDPRVAIPRSSLEQGPRVKSSIASMDLQSGNHLSAAT